MWIQDIIHYQVLGVPLWVGLLCGFISVLVDLDHIIAYYWVRGLDGRFLHTPLLIISCCVLCYLGACLARLFFRVVLRG